MKINNKLILLATLMSIYFTSLAASNVNLPTITVGDKSFYVYEIEKGDSFYGIAKKFGWNYDLFNRTNKVNNIKIKDGQSVFYPIVESDGNILQKRHTVEKGETIYSIAKKYGISTDEIYRLNPNAEYGIKVGEVLILSETVNSTTTKKEIIFYEIGNADTLEKIANLHNTSVQRIFELNPTLTPENFYNETTIKIENNSNVDQTTFETIEIRQIYAFKPYKIESEDTWTGISRRNGVSTEELKSSNPETTKLKKGKFLYIPLFETITVENPVFQRDVRELSEEGITEIYNEVHNTDRIYNPDDTNTVDVAIIIDIKNNKTRDAEFLKGFLLGVDYLKNNDYHINLKVFDISDETQTISTLTDSNELKNYDFIIATFDENFPKELADFGAENEIEIINLFDIKDEQYLTNHAIIQMLPPTSYFNDNVSQYLKTTFSDKTFVFIGETDADDSDAVDKNLRTYLTENNLPFTEIASLDHYSELQLAENGNYVLFPQITHKDDIDKFINTTIKFITDNPTVQISVVGRPNWITQAKNLENFYCQINTYIPSRFFFEKDSDAGKEFDYNFSNNYGYAPVQTNPIFAVVGYDTARFLIESYAHNRGDVNEGFCLYNALQTDFNLERINNWSGLINNCAYLIHFTPFGTIEKIKL